MKEYIIWGKQSADLPEQVLLSEKFGIKDNIEARHLVTQLKNIGCTDIRVQIIDNTTTINEDFIGAINL